MSLADLSNQRAGCRSPISGAFEGAVFLITKLKMSLKASNHAVGTDCPAVLTDKAGNVEIQSVGVLPVHTLAAIVMADVRTIRADCREVAVSTFGDC